MKWNGRERIDPKIDAASLVQQYGADIIADLTYQSQAKFKQHRVSNTMRHCIGVATSCVKFAQKLRIKVDVKSLIRGALLHDFYLYQYTECYKKGHFHHHGDWAAENAQKYFGINELEKGMICHHMWPIRFFYFPNSREAFILTLMDKKVGTKEFLGFKKIA